MVEVKNMQVFGLERAINAVTNSYTTGKINTLQMSMDDKGKRYKVACELGTSGEPHQSYDSWLRGVIVQFDMKYPLYFSPEFQRYHFAEIIMSQSTMHSLDEMMAGELDPYNKYVTDTTKEEVKRLYQAWMETKADIDPVSFAQKAQGSTEKAETIVRKRFDDEYEAFMRLRSNLPCGFEMWMTVSTNYLQLKTIWVQRHEHKLREDWGEGFCRDFIEKLPYFKKLCLGEACKHEALE